MTSFQGTRDFLSQILCDEQIQSLRPHINPIFYSEIKDLPLGIERTSKRSTIVLELRKLISLISDLLPSDILIASCLTSASDHIFLQELSTMTHSSIRFHGERREAKHDFTHAGSPVLSARIASSNNDPWMVVKILEQQPLSTLLDGDNAIVFANACTMVNQFGQALWLLENAQSKDPSVLSSLAYSKAMLWQRHVQPSWRSHDMAEKYFRESLELAQEADKLNQALCLNGFALHLMAGDVDKAIEVQEEALRFMVEAQSEFIVPPETEAVIIGNLARLYQRAGQPESALPWAIKSTSLEPDHSGHACTLLEVASSLGESNSVNQALAVLQQHANKQDVNALISLGNHADDLGQLEVAAGYFKRTIAIAPEFHDVRVQLCTNLVSRNILTEARELIDERPPGASTEQEVQFALLELELDSRNWTSCDFTGHAEARLMHLDGQFPNNPLIQRNLSIVRGASDEL